MVPSFDLALSRLHCAEEEYDEISSTESLLLYHGISVRSDECLKMMIEKEGQFLPNGDYLGRLRCNDVDLCGRMNAVDWIKKVHIHFGFGPLSLHLAVNYLDRFLSAYELTEGRPWMIQLLAVACVSIAAKMEEIEVPLTQDFQVAESKFVFEAKTIQRMELLVLSTLRWRMQAVTPFSFADTFLYVINGHRHPPRTLIAKSIQLISSTIEDIDYLEFRPSEVAAAVVIAVAGENQTLNDHERAINMIGLNARKERVVKCVEMLNDLLVMTRSRNLGSNSSIVSPTGVLDAGRLSYKTGSATNSDSGATTSTSTPNNKRRKIDSNLEVKRSDGEMFQEGKRPTISHLFDSLSGQNNGVQLQAHFLVKLYNVDSMEIGANIK